jgi:hypothetical protein
MLRAKLSSGMNTHVANAILVGFTQAVVAAKLAMRALSVMMSTLPSTSNLLGDAIVF